jgi:hypothetical protein
VATPEEETEIVIEPEVAPPAPQPRRHRRAVVAGVTLLAVVAGGFAIASDGGRRDEPKLALMAGGGTGAEMSLEAPTAAAGNASADASSRSSAPYPYGGWGLTFKVDGTLPELADHAAAWKVTGPTVDRDAISRMANALGLIGIPTQRDGGWYVDGGDWTLSAFPGGEMWSVNLFRGRYDGRADDAPAPAAGNDAKVGPALSKAEAENRVRALLDRMGAPAGSWRIETTETEIGVGWGCAVPGKGPLYTDEELKRLEADKLRQIDQQNPAAGSGSGSGTASSGAATPPPDVVAVPTPADRPAVAPDIAVAPCPAPPAPVKGFNVAVHPVLDGQRSDWPVWNVTLRSDGRVENLYGTWVTFQRDDDYKLRGVSAALKDLQSPPQAVAAIGGVTTDPAGVDPVAPAREEGPVTATDGDIARPEPASGGGSSGSTGSAPSRLPMPADGAAVTTPGMAMPAIACPPVPMPMPAEKMTSSYYAPECVDQTPQVVTITGVELALTQTQVWENGKARLAMVPAYRFVGHFDNGTPWETTVIALHPDAIAPPPDFPVADNLPARDLPAVEPAKPAAR